MGMGARYREVREIIYMKNGIEAVVEEFQYHCRNYLWLSADKWVHQLDSKNRL